MGLVQGSAADLLGPQTVGEALRVLRHRARASRDQLARATGLSAGAVSNYENGVSVPPAPALRRLCRALATLLEVDLDLLWAQLGEVLDETASPDTSQSRPDGDA
jgi:transcriptional regulator with XRE-family HTH domain